MKITVYTTPTCPYCKNLKKFLKGEKLSFKEVNVVENEKGRNEMMEKSGQMGVPVLDIDGTIIVGFEEDKLKEFLSKKK